MQKDIDIKLLREKHGWTQDQLAEQLGVDRSSISRMENGGRVRGPVRKLLEKLSFGEALQREAAE
jgi:transcriptional regulator with XRE-family HTH domain